MTRLWFPHLALWVVGIVLIRIVLVPAEQCPPTSAGAMMDSAEAAAGWLVDNATERGTFTYGYDRSTDTVSTGYSIVRHAGAMMALYQLVEATGDRSARAGGDAALAFLVDQALIASGDWVAVGQAGRPGSLGATGLTVAGLALRRDATGDGEYDQLMRSMGRFIVAQQQPDGSMLARWDRATGAPVPGSYDVFATGEAVWALAALHRLFPDEGWDRAATRTMDYLAGGTRERREGEIARLPDHWAAYALEELGRSGLVTDEYLGYARRLAGYFSLRLRVETQRTGEPANIVVRGWPGPPSGVGTAGEGMAALYRLATFDERLADLRPDMAARMQCAAGLMVQRQVSSSAAAGAARPEFAAGAWFYRAYTQMDDQQHVMSALLGAAGIEEEDR